jgi:hypothetical protein
VKVVGSSFLQARILRVAMMWMKSARKPIQVTMKLVLKLTVLLCESQNEDSLQWEHNQPLGISNSS